MRTNNKILFCEFCTDYLIDEKSLLGGIVIQMHFWAKTFAMNGWKTYCLTKFKNKDNDIVDSINNIFYWYSHHGKRLLVIIQVFALLLKLRPSVVVVRGRSAFVFPLALFAHIFKYKFLFMIAANTNMIDLKGIPRNSTFLFHLGLKLTKLFVAQNITQEELLHKNYKNKRSIIIPNIWVGKSLYPSNNKEKRDILWVSNIRKIKRPSWFLELAKKMPMYHFVMVGGPADEAIYNDCLQKAKALSNIDFKGKLSFRETNKCFTRAKLLVCTSISEGFPNTYLQAWSNGIPVVSTFDPNNLIKEKSLGMSGSTVEELIGCIEALMTDPNAYFDMQKSINNYFKYSHDPNIQYNKLIDFTFKQKSI